MEELTNPNSLHAIFTKGCITHENDAAMYRAAELWLYA